MRKTNYAITCSVGVDWSTEVKSIVCVCLTKEDALNELRYIAECSRKAGKRPILDEANGDLLIRIDGIGRTQAYEIEQIYE